MRRIRNNLLKTDCEKSQTFVEIINITQILITLSWHYTKLPKTTAYTDHFEIQSINQSLSLLFLGGDFPFSISLHCRMFVNPSSIELYSRGFRILCYKVITKHKFQLCKVKNVISPWAK